MKKNPSALWKKGNRASRKAIEAVQQITEGNSGTETGLSGRNKFSSELSMITQYAIMKRPAERLNRVLKANW